MVEGVGGRGVMNAEGVFGGSMFGIAFFQESTNFESAGVSATTSVENGRLHLIAALLMRNREDCLNIFPRDFLNFEAEVLRAMKDWSFGESGR